MKDADKNVAAPILGTATLISTEAPELSKANE